MDSTKKNNSKTLEEATENLVASIGALATAGAMQGIDNIVTLDPEIRSTITGAVSVGVMGLIKTIIRRVRNRIKHRRNK